MGVSMRIVKRWKTLLREVMQSLFIFEGLQTQLKVGLSEILYNLSKSISSIIF